MLPAEEFTRCPNAHNSCHGKLKFHVGKSLGDAHGYLLTEHWYSALNSFSYELKEERIQSKTAFHLLYGAILQLL